MSDNDERRSYRREKRDMDHMQDMLYVDGLENKLDGLLARIDSLEVDIAGWKQLTTELTREKYQALARVEELEGSHE